MNPQDIKIAKAGITRIKELVGDDDPDMLDIIEGETNAIELMDAIYDEESMAHAMVVGLDEVIGRLNERKKRYAAKVGRLKDARTELFEQMGVDVLERPHYRLGWTNRKPVPVVVDPDSLPDKLMVVSRKPDMRAIKYAIDNGEEYEGIKMSNGTRSMTTRVS